VNRRKMIYIILVIFGITAAGTLYMGLKIGADQRKKFFESCSFQGGQPVQTSSVLYICVGDDGRIIPITTDPQ